MSAPRISRRFLAKLAAAILVGLPLTVLPSFLLLWGLLAGLEGLFGPPAERTVRMGALTLAWSIGGFLGILGFWAWIFLARNARPKVRNLIAVMIVAGIASLLAFAFPFDSAEGVAIAAAGLVALGTPVLLLLRPGLRWNPDRPDPA